MLEIIKYHLGHLADFTGRDAKPTFWWFVLIVVVVQFLVGTLAAIPMMGGAMSAAFNAASAGAGPEAMEAQMLSTMGSAIGTTFWVSIATNILASVLLIAAFVRRVHDTGRAGWWALIPLATLAASTVIGIGKIDEMQAMFVNAHNVAEFQQLQTSLMRGNLGGLIGWAGLIVAAVLGALKSQDGPNEYGEAPVVLNF